MAVRMTLSLCLLAGAIGWGGCAPEEVQLESGELGLVGDAASSGCALVGLLGGDAVEYKYAGVSGTEPQPSVSGRLSGSGSPYVSADLGSCGPSGPYELSVKFGGQSVLRERVDVPDVKQSVVMFYAHTAREPRWSIAEVDLSSADPGLRRARFTNYIDAVQPIALFFYDASDQPVGESVSVEWGETWSGTIPVAATSYRLDPAQPVATPFHNPELPATPPTPRENLPCVEAWPVGLVIISPYWEQLSGDEPRFRGTSHGEEVYTYLPPVCAES